MKKGNLILLISVMAMVFSACKNDKATKVMDKAKDAVETVADATEDAVENVGNELKEVEADFTTDSDGNSIGSAELEELKKAEAEEANKPKVSKEKGKRPESANKPSTGKKPSSGIKPTKPTKTSKPSSGSSPIQNNNQSGTTGTTKPTKPTRVEEVKEVEEKMEESTSSEEIEEVVEEVPPAPQTAGTGKPSTEMKDVKDKPTGSTTGTTSEPTKVGKITKPGSTGGTTGSTNIGNKAAGFDHAPFNVMLGKFVSRGGVVNYSQLKASSRALNSYCAALSENPPKDSWSKNEKLAYWLNAYNAFTLKLITDNFPIASITDLNGGKPWDQKWIKIGSETLSLNGIENDIIRPRFNDARIHFGLNCAAKSCPPLANYAFTADNVNSKLNALTKSFINSSANQLSAGEASISKIFDWYKVEQHTQYCFSR